MRIYSFLISILIFSLLGCTRKLDQSSIITLSLPSSGPMSSKISSFDNTPDSHMSQSVGAYSSGDDEGPEWNILLNPTAIADVNCYMIAIAGPEADMRRNICTTTTGQSMYVGRWVGAMSAGQQLSIEVPSGSQREIIVIGFKASAGACTNFKTAEPNSANLSEPHIIGKVIQNLSPGDVTVSVPVTVSSNTLKIADCQGPDFNLGEGNQMYFGSAPAGDTNYDYTVPGTPVVHDLSVDAPLTPVNLNAAYGMVSALDVTTVTDATTVQLATSPTFSNFNAGDEVMVIVMGGRDTMGPAGNNDYGACGYRAWTGRYQFTKVRSKSTSPNKLVLEKGTFVDTLWKDADEDGIYFEATDDIQAANGTMINAYNNSSLPFCRLQIVKVPHFNTLLVQSGSTLTAPVFDWNSGGGVLAFRANELALGGSSIINMDHKGFQGVNDFNGDSISGRPTSASTIANANGGGRGVGTATAGGGGHGNEPQSPYEGPYSNSGGAGNTVSGGEGGHGVGDDCGATPSQSGYCFGSLSYKMFMGGAGGGNFNGVGVSGGSGGGIIFIAAKTYTTSSGHINSKGQDGNTGTGGGAGGSINFIFKTNVSTTANGAGYPLLNTNGGAGTPYAGAGAGGGAAGRVHTLSCSGQHFDSSAISLTGGGTGGGIGTAAAGLDSMSVISSVPCP